MTSIKVPAATIKAYEKAKESALQALHAAHDVEESGRTKAAEMRGMAINTLIDKGRAAGADTGAIKDDVRGIFDRAAEAGYLAEKSAKLYMRGLAFALDRGVMWNASLHGTEARVKALQDAGKPIPKDLQEAAAKMEEKEAQAREARQPVGDTVDTALAKTVKVLAIWRTLGKSDVASYILDAIHSIKPEFTEPKAD